MRLNPELKLRKVGRHSMVVDVCSDNMNLTNVYVLNDTAAWLWEAVAGMDFTEDTLVDLLCCNYDVAQEQAREDVRHLIEKLSNANIVLDNV